MGSAQPIKTFPSQALEGTFIRISGEVESKNRTDVSCSTKRGIGSQISFLALERKVPVLLDFLVRRAAGDSESHRRTADPTLLPLERPFDA